MNRILQDVRYGVRRMVRAPGFAVVALLTLAIGIGANTAVFSIVQAVLLAPLPYSEPDRIVGLFTSFPAQGVDRDIFSPANFDDVATAPALEASAAYTTNTLSLTQGAEPVALSAVRSTPGLFRALGIGPLHGRTWTEEEDRAGAGRVVVLSHAMWQQRLGGESNVVGSAISLNGEPWTVIGVMPPGFDFPGGTDVWAPLALTPEARAQRGAIYLSSIARIRPGATMGQAQAQLDTIADRLRREYPNDVGDMKLMVFPLRDVIVGNVRPAVLVVWGAVGFVLLVACVNLANLLLAAASARRQEFTVRVALGASRRRIFAQLLTESIFLALVGGILGSLVAAWLVAAMPSLLPPQLPLISEIALNWRVLGFTALISVGTGILFGMAPAFGVARSSLHDDLKGIRAAGSSGRSRLRSALVVTEVALVLVLLAGAGLVIKSFARVASVDPGFRPERLLALQLSLPRAGYPQPPARSAFANAVLERIQAMPGVQAAALVSPAPFGPANTVNDISFFVVGQPVAPPPSRPVADFTRISPRYFETAGIRMVRGRDFTASDAGQLRLAIVNQALAERLFPGQDPVGQKLGLGSEKPLHLEIVGMVADVKRLNLARNVRPEIYVPNAQSPAGFFNLYIRTTGDPDALVQPLRQAVWSLDKTLPADNYATLDRLLARSLADRRFTTTLMSGFAAIALVLALVGIYGVVSYSVAQRTREIGVRIALGARTGNILGMVLRQGMAMSVAGIAAGLAGAFALTRLLSTLLFQVSAVDPLVFAGVALLLAAATLVACLVPARRASKVDPLVALRYE